MPVKCMPRTTTPSLPRGHRLDVRTGLIAHPPRDQLDVATFELGSGRCWPMRGASWCEANRRWFHAPTEARR